MMDEAFEDLFDSALQSTLKRSLLIGQEFLGYNSIKGFKVFRRVEKSKKWIFTSKKRIRVIQILVIEHEFVMEKLFNDKDIVEIINTHSDDHILEFVSIFPGEEKSISYNWEEDINWKQRKSLMNMFLLGLV